MHLNNDKNIKKNTSKFLVFFCPSNGHIKDGKIERNYNKKGAT